MINKYLSDEVVTMLQNAFYHEKENSLIYSNLSVWLNSKGLVNLSKYYDDWSQEEYNHGSWVKDFMMSLDVPLSSGQSKCDKYDLESNLLEFANVTLYRENLTTQIYRDMTISALDMNDLGSAMLLTFSQKMSAEQTEETDKILTLYAKIKNIESYSELQLFDNTFEA